MFRCLYGYRSLLVILPLLKSYGVISINTRSPGITFIIFTRILPERCPKTTCPDSSCTRKIALGKFSMTLPSSSSISFLWPDFPKSCVLVEITVFEIINLTLDIVSHLNRLSTFYGDDILRNLKLLTKILK